MEGSRNASLWSTVIGVKVSVKALMWKGVGMLLCQRVSSAVRSRVDNADLSGGMSCEIVPERDYHGCYRAPST